MARTKHRYPPLLFFSTYSRSHTLGSVPRERVSKTTLFNPISLVCFSPMHRAARHGIGRDPGRGYHGKLHVRHGKRWPPPGTVSEPFSSRWPTIRHPYLSGDFCCRCVALPVQLRSTAMRYTYMCVYCAPASCPEFSLFQSYRINLKFPRGILSTLVILIS